MTPGALATWTRARAEEYRLTYLLVVLVFAMFVASPLVKIGVLRPVVVDVTFVLLLIVGVASVAGRRELTIGLAAMAGLALIVRLVVSETTGPTAVLAAVLTMLFFALLAAAVLGPVLSYGRITSRHIEGAVVVYLLLGLLWGLGYQLLSDFVPGAFNPRSADAYTLYYFSLVTLTTVGYGDIVPVHPLARSLATAEAVTGPLFLAILVARLVSQALATGGGGDDRPLRGENDHPEIRGGHADG